MQCSGNPSVAVERRAEDEMGFWDATLACSLGESPGFDESIENTAQVHEISPVEWLAFDADEVCEVCREASKTRQKMKGERDIECPGLASRRHETG